MASFNANRRCGSQVLVAAILAWCGGVVVMIAVGAPRIVDAALQQKPGVCPPLNRQQVCMVTCYEDFDCRGNFKCCKTQCGGSMCAQAVSSPRPKRNETGVCPEPKATPWVCGNRCSGDEDCRAGSKCCVHRCGGRSCLRALPAPPNPFPGANPPSGFSGNVDPNYPGVPVRFY